MHRRLRVRGELAHRRRAAEPLGAVGQLRQDLLVRVPLPDPRLERRERLRIDACHRGVAAGSSHASSVEHPQRFASSARTGHVPGTVPRTWPKRPWTAARSRAASDARGVVRERLERQDPLERADAARAELGAGGAAELGERLLERPGGAVDPRRQHRVERVGDVDDAGAERDLLVPEPVGVAGAVEALVVMADRRHGVAEEAEAVDDARALVGVALHQRPLLLREARRLEQDRVRDRELADVVEERRVAEQVELGLREAELAADRQRELLHAARVAGGVGVARVDGRREALHRRGRALLEQPVRLLERDVLGVDRLRGLAQLLRAPAGVREVRLLRLAHQQQRHREDGEGVEPGRVVADRDHAADEAVDDVVRQQPEEALVPDAPDVLAALHRECDREQAGVDREVDARRRRGRLRP